MGLITGPHVWKSNDLSAVSPPWSQNLFILVTYTGLAAHYSNTLILLLILNIKNVNLTLFFISLFLLFCSL